jgi:serine/threonine-protein kinase
MKISAPILTLLAGGALAGGLIVANGVTAGGAAEPASAVQVAGQGADADKDGATGDDAGAKDEEQAAGREKAAGDAAAGSSAEGTPGGAAENAQQKVRRTYAGRVKGGGPLLAITVRDGVAIAYICDGDDLEAWLKGTAVGDELALEGEDGASLSASFDAKRATGSVTVDGETYKFHTPTVKKPSGLWKATAEVRGAKVEAGWVVLADGKQVGMVTREGAAGVAAPRLDVRTGRATYAGQELAAVATDADTGAGF